MILSSLIENVVGSLLILLLVFLLIYLGLYLFTNKIYKSMYGKRIDRTFLHFFNENDFEGLKKETFVFKNNNNDKLKAYKYYLEQAEYKGIVVFACGYGAGHEQYTSEFNYYARKGFIVLTYDNSGIMESEGVEIGGLPQGIIDLRCFLDEIKTHQDLRDYKKILMGHSWGAYSVINNLPFLKDEDNVKGCVSMGAPFNSSEITYEMLVRTAKWLKFTGPFISIIEKKKFDVLSKMNTYSSLANVETKTLLIHGDEDNVVDYEANFMFVKNALTKDNVKYYTVLNRGHRVNITKEAYEYSKEVDKIILENSKSSSEKKKEIHDSFDYHKLVEFDNKVMSDIDEFIEDCLNEVA